MDQQSSRWCRLHQTGPAKREKEIRCVDDWIWTCCLGLKGLMITPLPEDAQAQQIMRILPISLSIVACLAVFPGAIQAQTFDMSIDCKRVEKEGGNNYEMGQCAGRAYEASKAQLALVLKKLRAQMPDDSGRKLLDESQALWSKWKAKEPQLCALSSGYSPEGSGYGLQWSTCAAEMTRARTEQLRRYLTSMKTRL